MKTVLITGGSGLVANSLSNRLTALHHEVRILTTQKNIGKYYWNPAKEEIDSSVFEGLDAIVHLAGAPISKRWTKANKNEIYESRVKSAELLYNGVQKAGIRLSSFISASGVNYYGTETRSHLFVEEDPASNDFLGQLCADWEAAAQTFTNMSSRVCCVRTAVVLSPKGGMLKKLMPLAKLGLVSPLGSGHQIVPWIHIDDLIEIYVRLLESPDLSGAFNAAATEIVNSKTFTKSLAKAVGTKVILPNVPGFVLRMMFGETSSIMLEGSAVSNKKIKESGFRFKFDNLDAALKNLLG